MIKFPYLVERNEAAIKQALSELQNSRTDTAAQLNAFRDAFAQFLGKFTFISFLDFLKMDSEVAKAWLLAPQLKLAAKASIKESQRMQYIHDYFDLPKYAPLLEYHASFSKDIEQVKAMYNEAATVFDTLPINEAKQQEITEQYSLYVNDQMAYERFIAMQSLIEGVSYFAQKRSLETIVPFIRRFTKLRYQDRKVVGYDLDVERFLTSK